MVDRMSTKKYGAGLVPLSIAGFSGRSMSTTVYQTGLETLGASASAGVQESCSTPNQALAFLGRYNQHWWRRRVNTIAGSWVAEISDNVTTGMVSGSTDSGTYRSISYADSIDISESGAVSLVNPSTVDVSYNQYTNANLLKGKYFYWGSASFNPPGYTNFTKDSFYFVNADAPNATRDRVSGYYPVTIAAHYVSAKYVETGEIGEWAYIRDSNHSAYPENGVVDGYEYEYLGVPFDNAVGAPKIATGSYAGTGTYGSDNPNSLTFGFAPKMVLICSCNNFAFLTPRSSEFPSSSSDDIFSIYANSSADRALSFVRKRQNGEMIQWYSTSSANQLNISGTEYYYVALG